MGNGIIQYKVEKQQQVELNSEYTAVPDQISSPSPPGLSPLVTRSRSLGKSKEKMKACSASFPLVSPSSTV